MLNDILTSPIFMGSMSLITNFGLQYMTQDLQYFAKEIFKHSAARKAVLFALLFSATRSIKLSLIMTLVILAFNKVAERQQKHEEFLKSSKGTQTEVNMRSSPLRDTRDMFNI